VPRRSCSATDCRQSQGIVETRGNASEPESIDAGRREPDGERYPVKLPADVDDQRHIDIPQPEFAEYACRALDEQLNGRDFEGLGRAETARYGRDL
jgi:hypothetical protein